MKHVDYRNPRSPGNNSLTLASALKQQAQQSGGGGVLLLAGGVTLSLFTMIWPAGIVAWLSRGYLNFWICYLIAILILVPLIYKKIRDTRLAYDDTDYDLATTGNIQYGGIQTNSIKLEAAMVVGWIMMGPHLIVEGVKQAQGIQSLRHTQMLDRCATLLEDLARIGVATPVHMLIKENETIEEVQKLIKYLDHYDWVGASSDLKRAWLSSKSQSELPKYGVKIGRN